MPELGFAGKIRKIIGAADKEAARKKKRALYQKEYRKTYEKKRPRLTLSEKDEALFNQALSKFERRRLAPFILDCAKSFLFDKRCVLPEGTEERLDKLVSEINRCGNSLNQIAKKCNFYRKAGLFDLKKVKKDLASMKKAARDFIYKL